MARGGRDQGLTSLPRHGPAMTSLRSPGQVDLFLDLAPWMGQLGAEAASNGEMAANAFAQSGVDGMGWASGRLGVGAGERLDFEVVLDVPPGTLVARVLDLMRPLQPLGCLSVCPRTPSP